MSGRRSSLVGPPVSELVLGIMRSEAEAVEGLILRLEWWMQDVRLAGIGLDCICLPTTHVLQDILAILHR